LELFVSRTPWLTIRAPLSGRRTTILKVCAFLCPLASWALVCLIWLPDVIITDQGDGHYKIDDRTSKADFELENNRIRALPSEYRFTEKTWQELQTAVPPAVLKKLSGVKPYTRSDGVLMTLAWKTEDEFVDAVKDDFELEPDVLAKNKDIIWNHFEREDKELEKGKPSTKIWLPPPWKVAGAFYHAFVTPPNGCGFKLTDEAFRTNPSSATTDEAPTTPTAPAATPGTQTIPATAAVKPSKKPLVNAGVPESIVAKLKHLEGKFFFYSDRDKFEAELAKSLEPDEYKRYHTKIVDYAYVTTDKWLHENLWHSCQIIFLGFIFSAIVGVPLGILCGTFDFFSKLYEPFIDFIRYMPAPAFAVLCTAILGIDDWPKIAIIWIGTFFQMVLVVANTTRQFDESLLEAAQTLGASKRSLLLKVILPGILPSLYNDMRILLGWAWTYLIVAEVVGVSSGISYFINMQGKYRHFDNAYAGIIMIGIIGLACDQVLAALARVLFPWMPKHKGAGAWAAFFSAVAYLQRLVRGGTAVAPAVPKKPAAA
jgi:ABC-type nitrate/sulfonate/bicarbonate transport system permease component